MSIETTALGVGHPAWQYLHIFGEQVHRVFGVYPILVGSSLHKKEARDVDIRLVLPLQRLKEWEGAMGDVRPTAMGSRWKTLNLAFTALANHMSGLSNVDFQIYSEEDALRYKSEPYCPLGNWMPPKHTALTEAGAKSPDYEVR